LSSLRIQFSQKEFSCMSSILSSMQKEVFLELFIKIFFGFFLNSLCYPDCFSLELLIYFMYDQFYVWFKTIAKERKPKVLIMYYMNILTLKMKNTKSFILYLCAFLKCAFLDWRIFRSFARINESLSKKSPKNLISKNWSKHS